MSGGPTRRRWLQQGAAVALGLPALQAAGQRAGDGRKVLRYAFEVAETSLDPAKVQDFYSRILTAHLFEGLYRYDHLARPVKIRPLTAAGMPEISDDFRTWTIRLQPGIFFADDPAFKGQRRELVANDYAYVLKRFADPANKSPVWPSLDEEGILGLAEARQAALDAKKPFDYDREIPGVRALDRYTLQIRFSEPRPRLLYSLASSDLFGAVAREVVEHYGEQIDAHPVGTGPFVLKEWRRSSFLAFERNPQYREVRYDEQPAADDAEGQAILARLKGRRLPMVDRVEVSIIEEDQPRWLSFVNGEADVAYRVGFQFVPMAMPNGKVAPNLAKRGIVGYRVAEPASNFVFFNMEDDTVGGYTPPQVALRRAIALAMDTRREIEYAYSGMAGVAQSFYLPLTSAHHPDRASAYSLYDPARAKALLDIHGFVDRDRDGWRERPDGTPLLLKMAAQTDQRTRRINEVFQKNMQAIGVRTQFEVAQWPENLKAARAGRLQMWQVGLSAASPDAQPALMRVYSPAIGGQNFARMKLPRLDAIYDRMKSLPDGPERQALFDEAEKLVIAYMPYKVKLDRYSIDMAYGHVVGYRHPVFWNEWWQFVDIDRAAAAARSA